MFNFDCLYKILSKILILRSIQLDIIINVHRSSYKVPVIIVRYQQNSNFIDRFSKHPNTKFRPMRAELFRA
jgi:hypothetical protein